MKTLMLVSFVATSLVESVVFKDGAYSGIQVRISENTPVEDCTHILERLQVNNCQIVQNPGRQKARSHIKRHQERNPIQFYLSVLAWPVTCK